MEALSACDGCFCTFCNCFLCPLTINVKDSWGQRVPFCSFPILPSLLGNNRCLTRGWTLQLRHQRRQRFDTAFRKCPQRVWRCSPTASTDRKHLQDCLCFCLLQSSSAFFLSWNENSSSFAQIGVCMYEHCGG